MNPPELKQFALDIRLDDEECFELRLEFGIACVLRVEHLLTETDVIDALSTGKRFLAGECGKNELSEAAALAAKVARSHAGSNSLDGAGSAAVSTSHGVAAA